MCTPGRAGEGLHKEVGDAPLDERHPGVVDLRLAWHGCEVVDDHDVVISNNLFTQHTKSVLVRKRARGWVNGNPRQRAFASVLFISVLFQHLPALKSLLSPLNACEEVPFGG